MDITLSNYAWIKKSQLTASQIEKIKEKLTIKPRRTYRKQEDPDPIALYCEEEERIGVPRSYFLERRQLDHNITVDVSMGRELSLEFNGNLRPDQAKAVNSVMMNRVSGGMGGVVQAAPGWGKTVMSLNLFTRIGRSTIVIVNKSFLLKQWMKRIKGTKDKEGKIIKPGYVPDAKVGIIQASKLEYGPNYDISIAMIHTLSEHVDDLPSDFWSSFGLVITDEVHRIGAPTWGCVVPKFNASYRLGVTATPRRKDRAESVFFWHIGEIIHVSKTKRVTPRLRRVFTRFVLRSSRSYNPELASPESQVRRLVADKDRNELIVSELLMAAKRGRKIIVLSERRKHLETLDEMFMEHKPTKKVDGKEVPITSAYYVGGMKDEDLDESEMADVIWSTYKMAAEALDIEALDTAFFVSPVSDPEQAAGRIMRVYADKEPPVITDFIDAGVPEFARRWNSRKEFYVKEGMYVPKDGE